MKSASAAPLVSRFDQKQRVHRPRATFAAQERPGLSEAQDVLKSPGVSLDPPIRSQMETSFARGVAPGQVRGAPSLTRGEAFAFNSPQGNDEREAEKVADAVSRNPARDGEARKGAFSFGNIRVHTDPKAAASAGAMGAAAYTAGSHIVFAQGRFAPGTAEGKELLAHELTHALQQTSTSGRTETSAPVSSSLIARKPSYPKIHETVLNKLIELARRIPKDGAGRLPELLEVAKSVSQSDRALLYERLTDLESRDRFSVYFRDNYPLTRSEFLQEIGPVRIGTSSDQAAAEEPLIPSRKPGETPSKPGAEFVSSRYADVQSDPMYIDNFTNDINDAWLPNDRKFVFEYAGGVGLQIALPDLIKALQVKSDLNPQPTEEENRKKYKIPDDLVLPQSTSQSPLLTVGNKNDFFRDSESKIIYPTGDPVYKIFLPRISNAVEQIEAIRIDQELLQRNLIPILNRIVAMEWSAPRGLGPLLVRIGRFARSRKAAGLVGEVAKEAAELEAKARVKPPTPHEPVPQVPEKTPVPPSPEPAEIFPPAPSVQGHEPASAPKAPQIDPDATPPYGMTKGGKPVIRIENPEITVGPDEIRATWLGDPRAVAAFKTVEGGGLEVGYINAGAQTGQGPKLLGNALRKAARQLNQPNLVKPSFLKSSNVVNKTLSELVAKGAKDQAETIARRSALAFARELGATPGAVQLTINGEKITVIVKLTY